MKKMTLLQTALCLIGISLASLIPGAYEKVNYQIHPQSLFVGLICSIPLLVFGYFFLSKNGQKIRPFREIFSMIEDSPFGRAIERGTLFWFLTISSIAGVFEELIFRGILQNQIGLIPSALIFGLAHFVSWTYFVIATFIGLYLGTIYFLSEVNLIIPTVVHLVYDFVLLIWFQKRILRSSMEA